MNASNARGLSRRFSRINALTSPYCESAAFNVRSMARCCLLYTSDAADELDGVDLGGRRIF